MSNFFKDVLGDAKKVEQELLGPDYKYWKQINSPSDMDMSDDGSLSVLAADIKGLINYVELLVAGGGGASKVDGPLGDKFFLKTGGTCKDKASNKSVNRYIYINNVPDGNIPFLSSAMGGKNFSSFEGLVPGALGNLGALNPFAIFQAFMMGTEPPCQQVRLQTIDVNNNKSTETQYVALADIQNMDPCWFPDNKNPVTNDGCSEAFQNINDKSKLPSDYLVKVFYGSLGILGLYILFRLMKKYK